MADTTDSVSLRKDSVSKLLSLGSDISAGLGLVEDRDRGVETGGRLGNFRLGRAVVGNSGGGGLCCGCEGGLTETPEGSMAAASCCWTT